MAFVEHLRPSSVPRTGGGYFGSNNGKHRHVGALPGVASWLLKGRRPVRFANLKTRDSSKLPGSARTKKDRKASEFRLTVHPDNISNYPPSKEFMHWQGFRSPAGRTVQSAMKDRRNNVAGDSPGGRTVESQLPFLSRHRQNASLLSSAAPAAPTCRARRRTRTRTRSFGIVGSAVSAVTTCEAMWRRSFGGSILSRKRRRASCAERRGQEMSLRLEALQQRRYLDRRELGERVRDSVRQDDLVVVAHETARVDDVRDVSLAL